jgi:hypothetical protein
MLGTVGILGKYQIEVPIYYWFKPFEQTIHSFDDKYLIYIFIELLKSWFATSNAEQCTNI